MVQGKRQHTLIDMFPPCQVATNSCIPPAPADDQVSTTSRRCNTVGCPTATSQLTVGQHSTCSTQGCGLLPSTADGAQLVCINSVG